MLSGPGRGRRAVNSPSRSLETGSPTSLTCTCLDGSWRKILTSAPSTGAPEPGGGRWWPTLELLEALFRRSRVVAADVVELAPIPGLHHADFTVARLVYKLIGLAAEHALVSGSA